MMKLFKRILMLLMIFSGTVFAGNVEFDVNPKIIQLGEAGSCTVKVHDIKSPQEPHLTHDDFNIQSAGTGSQMSYINGQKSRSQTFNFRFVPLKTGEYTIGPFDYEVKRGQVVKLPPVKIKVVAPSKTSNNSQNVDISKFLFSTITSERNVVYEQETVELTLSIYSKGLRLGGQIKLIDFQTDGLSLGEFSDVLEGREMVDGELFNVKQFKVKAHVTKSGKVTAAPVLGVPVITKQERNRFGDPFFDDAFRSSNMVKVVAKPLEIKSEKIPLKGRPADYSGAVGQFKMSVSLTPTELKAGEPVNVKIDINGRGNINVITAPDISYGDQFKYYDANLVENNTDKAGFEGRKTFEQVAIPRSENVTEFPEIRFSYFDTAEGIYKTITQGPFPLIVTKGELAEINTSSTVAKDKVKDVEEKQIVGGEDIVYLKAAPAKWERSGFAVFSTNNVLLGYIAPISVLIGFILWGFKNRYFHRDEIILKRRLALKKASKMLKGLSGSDSEVFYDTVFKAVNMYISDYYNQSQGESIPFDRMDTSVADDVKQILKQCEFARFSGQKLVMEDAEEWLAHILKVLKNNEKSNGRGGVE